jgi:hypothetical protein
LGGIVSKSNDIGDIIHAARQFEKGLKRRSLHSHLEPVDLDESQSQS